MKFLI